MDSASRDDHSRPRLEHLKQLDRSALTAKSVAEFADDALAQLDHLVPAPWSAVFVLRPRGEEVELLAGRGAQADAHMGATPAGIRPGLRLSVRMMPAFRRLRRGQLLSTPDIRALRREDTVLALLRDRGLRAVAAVPLGPPTELLGVLVLARSEPGCFSAEELEIAEDTARRLGLALQEEQRERALLEGERRYRQLFDGIPLGLFQADPSGLLLDVNDALAGVLGYPDRTSLLTRRLDQLFADDEVWSAAQERMDRIGVVRDLELRARRPNGEVVWLQLNARVLRDEDGNILRHEGSLQDITGRRRAEEQLLHDAVHDPLTGLPNRAFLLDRLDHALETQRRHRGFRFAVVFMDFDRFKVVNDSLGHLYGDRLLVAAARRLEGSVREVDTVARLSGDEFAVLLDGIGDVWDAIRVVERIEQGLHPAFVLDQHEVFLTMSLGLALSAERYERPEDMLRDADIAMYRAKARGRGGHVVFDSGMQERAVVLLRMETELRRGLERGEFRLWFQPVVGLAPRRTVGFEALLRWQHPARGLLAPSAFIEVAEESGLVVPLGLWALQEACRRLRAWRQELPGGQRLTMGVNVSGRQLHHPAFLGDVRRALSDSGLEPGALWLEITETAVMRDPEAVLALMHSLRELGVGLAVDDFGRGYSSLVTLRRYPFGLLKTDGSFAAPAEWESGGREIVRSVVTLAQGLGLDLVVEGVESAGQVEELQAWGCRYAQGFFFSQPLEGSAVRDLAALVAGEGR